MQEIFPIFFKKFTTSIEEDFAGRLAVSGESLLWLQKFVPIILAWGTKKQEAVAVLDFISYQMKII